MRYASPASLEPASYDFLADTTLGKVSELLWRVANIRPPVAVDRLVAPVPVTSGARLLTPKVETDAKPWYMQIDFD